MSNSFSDEVWHLNCFNMCEVIVIRDGADPRGHLYIDGRHQLRVNLYEDMRAARDAVRQHNLSLAVKPSPVAETDADAQRDDGLLSGVTSDPTPT